MCQTAARPFSWMPCKCGQQSRLSHHFKTMLIGRDRCMGVLPNQIKSIHQEEEPNIENYFYVMRSASTDSAEGERFRNCSRRRQSGYDFFSRWLDHPPRGGVLRHILFAFAFGFVLVCSICSEGEARGSCQLPHIYDSYHMLSSFDGSRARPLVCCVEDALDWRTAPLCVLLLLTNAAK